jgi:hypothetical protein
MQRLQIPCLAVTAAALLGANAFAQNATTAPRPAPGTVITDEDTTGPRTGTSGTGNSSGAQSIIRTRPAGPVGSPVGGTISPSAGTAERNSRGPAIVPAAPSGAVPSSGGTTGSAGAGGK